MDAALAARGMPAVEAGHITDLQFIFIAFYRLINLALSTTHFGPL